MNTPTPLRTWRPDILAEALRVLQGAWPTVHSTEGIAEVQIADAIADLLHLAAANEIDVDDVLEHGRSYYEGDLEGPLP